MTAPIVYCLSIFQMLILLFYSFCLFIDAPEFALSPSTDGSNVVNRSVVVGSNILLNCSVSAANPPVTNSSLNYESTSGSGSASNVDTSTGHFSISSATETNTGTYTCTVTNLVATSELTYNIIVGSEYLFYPLSLII